MKSFHLKWLRLAILAFLISPMAMPAARATAGRDYSRCIHACNQVRRACDDRCVIDCQAQFPNAPAQAKICVSSCHEICVNQEQDCKDRCLAVKRGESPQEP